MLEQLLAADTSLFLWINVALYNPVVGTVLQLLTYLGEVWFWLPVSAVALYYRRLLGARLAAGLVISNVLVLLLKILAARPRPYEVLQGIHVLDTDQFSSFPSGHAANVFMAAFILSIHYPKYRWAFYGLAIVVSFSRIYVGVHYPLDVVAGALLGIAVGWTAVRWVKSEKLTSRK